MDQRNILSILWQNIRKSGIINEEILAENTFIQQTSIGGVLWKAQLGMTENFVIFLRCDNVVMSNNEYSNNLSSEEMNILINMIPMNRLKIRKHRRRTLEVIFPSGIAFYFKLLKSDGCGHAWTRWKSLEHVSATNVLSTAAISLLIPFRKLSRKLQKIIIADGFAKCFTNFSRYSSETCDSEFLQTPDRIKFHGSKGEKLKPDADLQIVEDVNERVKHKEKLDAEESLDEDIKTLPGTSNDKKKRRKKRQIRRFGEGIPENCNFELTLSYSDDLVVDDISNFDKDDDDELYETIPLDERVTKMFGRRFSDSSETEEEEILHKAHDRMSFQERASRIFGKSFSHSLKETKSAKIPPSKIENKQMRNHNRKMKNILNTAQFFTNISLLIIPDGLRMSKSVDSIRQIRATKCEKIYVTRNISLPKINEMIFYRRCNRLSYCMGYFENNNVVRKRKNHYIHPIAFWLPDKKSSGRVYCTVPVCRKISAEKVFSEKQNVRQINLEREIHSKRTIQSGQINVENEKSWSIREDRRKNDKSENIIACEYEECEPEKELRTVLEASSVHVEETEGETGPTGRIVEDDIEKNKIRSPALDPFTVAYKLHMIQQRMFCEIESSELMRFILKPHTVTEMTCPYLCGFLFFFERLKNLIEAELSTQKDDEEFFLQYELYVQVALACFKRRDEQSAYAIMSGLCNPKISNHKKLLKENTVINKLMQLFKKCYKRRKLCITHKKVPFFLDFITFIVKEAIKRCTISSTNPKETMWYFLSGSFQDTESNTRCKRVFSELTAWSYKNYETIFAVIEESRKYFLMDEDYFENNTFTRDYLLYKRF